MHNKVNAEIKRANKTFYKYKFSESDGNLHKTWHFINELILLINLAGQSVKELSLNGVSMTNTAL